MGILRNTHHHTTMSAAAPKKATKAKAPAAHPKYSVMIAAAITSLKDRTGSSRQAILKYICANYKVDAAKAAVQVRLALKRGVAKGAPRWPELQERELDLTRLLRLRSPRRSRRLRSQRPRSPRRLRRQRSQLPRRLRSQRRLRRSQLI